MNGPELTTETMCAHHRIMRSEHDPKNWDRPNIEEEADAEFYRWLNKIKAEALKEAADSWEQLVQSERPPIRGSLFLMRRADQIEGEHDGGLKSQPNPYREEEG